MPTLREISFGVPKVSILETTLFSVFINGLTTSCHIKKIRLYAGDAQIYFSRSLGLVEDFIEEINYDLRNTVYWSNENNLRLNSTKTKVIAILHGTLDVISLPRVVMVNDYVVNIVFNLGFKLNSKPNADDHIKK